MPVNHAQAVLNGERLALTRALTQIENNTAEGLEILEALFPHTGKAHLIGVTGAPGTGKSTLVNQLALAYRQPADGTIPPRVAIVAVDPTSPFTGGAILGDRVRMQDLAGDPGIFIRSMASRGSLGGLAAATAGLVQVFDAAGFEIIIIETVGAGQAEVDIARLAHSTIVIEAPGLGDEIQTIKAGILEIADILVVNKSDKPGAENTLRALRNMLSMAHPEGNQINHHGQLMEIDTEADQTENDWIPAVLPTVATSGEGIPDLVSSLNVHIDFLKSSDLWQLREEKRLKNQLETLLGTALRSRWEKSISPDIYQAALAKVIKRELSPWRAVEELIQGAGL
ncbi:MAG: methylmalonyl Co-A mutase-associated GTPase MeaB [Anaerolineales bacterium]|nr:methylmalonyl Co-A mutase-associated GTPase MeaB [Anaerolineales bacterium]